MKRLGMMTLVAILVVVAILGLGGVVSAGHLLDQPDADDLVLVCELDGSCQLIPSVNLEPLPAYTPTSVEPVAEIASVTETEVVYPDFLCALYGDCEEVTGETAVSLEPEATIASVAEPEEISPTITCDIYFDDILGEIYELCFTSAGEFVGQVEGGAVVEEPMAEIASVTEPESLDLVLVCELDGSCQLIPSVNLEPLPAYTSVSVEPIAEIASVTEPEVSLYLVCDEIEGVCFYLEWEAVAAEELTAEIASVPEAEVVYPTLICDMYDNCVEVTGETVVSAEPEATIASVPEAEVVYPTLICDMYDFCVEVTGETVVSAEPETTVASVTGPELEAESVSESLVLICEIDGSCMWITSEATAELFGSY